MTNVYFDRLIPVNMMNVSPEVDKPDHAVILGMYGDVCMTLDVRPQTTRSFSKMHAVISMQH